MKKAYIQPEAEVLSLAVLEDFLVGSTGNSAGDGFTSNESGSADENDWDDSNPVSSDWN